MCVIHLYSHQHVCRSCLVGVLHAWLSLVQDSKLNSEEVNSRDYMPTSMEHGVATFLVSQDCSMRTSCTCIVSMHVRTASCVHCTCKVVIC